MACSEGFCVLHCVGFFEYLFLVKNPDAILKKYSISLLFVLFASIFGQLLYERLAPTNLIMLYLAAVLLTAYWLGRGPAILASLMSVLTFDVLFVPPRFSLSVHNAQYFITFTGLLGVGLLISGLVSQLRLKTTAAQANERKALALYQLSNNLSKGSDSGAVRSILSQTVKSVLRAECRLFLDTDDNLKASDSPAQPVDPDTAAKRWTFLNVQSAGQGMPLWPDAKMAYFPVSSGLRVLGVIGIQGNALPVTWTPENRQWVETLANQTAVVLERVYLFEEAKALEIVREKERFQTTLLNSLSHDLRTPLVAITGALSHLAGEPASSQSLFTKEMVDNAKREADRLNLLVTQWIDMARAETGSFKINMTLCDLRDLAGVAFKDAAFLFENRTLNIHIPADFPEINVDFPLFLKVIYNLLDNAVKFSPPTAPIDVMASVTETHMVLDIADRGPGIPEEHRDKVFTKFYRVALSPKVSGMGLGLSICRAIVAAHSGEITVHPRPGGGSIFRIRLPLPVNNRPDSL